MNFETFSFSPAVIAGIRKVGYKTPTPIQCEAIPPILQGKDLIGLAQTGTGKTAAYALPILQRLITSPRDSVGAAVIAPTRELAKQTCQVFNDLGMHTGLHSMPIYGGVGIDRQLTELRNGVRIVVGCPGRILDHLWKGTLDFTNLEVLVIDEADRMFDMGFLPSIRMILDCILQPRQTLLFSATMPPEIKHMVQEVLYDPVMVQIDRTLPAKTVSHTLYPVKEHLKTALLKDILRNTDTESVLVFTRTKYRAEWVGKELQKDGFNAISLQGDMSQQQRQAAFNGFRDGYFKIMVATDIAARGIDVLSISHVINYDMPADIESYIHRIGRTGRVNQEGSAFTFVTGQDNSAVSNLEGLLNTKLERRTLPSFDYKRTLSEKNPARFTRRARRKGLPVTRFVTKNSSMSIKPAVSLRLSV